ncbi:DUF418 domain-containing protein [Altererythrobacter sp. Root672]|uniref:DUF418 domain-containing protein n=1 Tax=Altererythrobacter sp. Root672 TaxID=1736584 RepID=UPI0006F74E5A|nr:DUF418 domain-containing protein [Altererythrobacter sp. Root672]KRA82662.1 hypothetical protein ASD76_00770 [Altererythrobacter sp. Root672]
MSEVEVQSAAPSQPVSAAERIVALDFIRGIAVLGILFPNIVAYGHPMLAYYWPEGLPGGSTAFDRFVWLFQFVLIDGKLRGIFTLLFGAGLILFLDRVDARGGRPDLQIRRLAWLGVFGAAHTFLIWTGDILLLYAVAGFGALLMTGWDARAQLRIGVAWFLAGALVFSAAFGSSLAAEGFPPIPDPTPLSHEQAQAGAADLVKEANEETEVTQVGDWPKLVAWRVTQEGPELPFELLFFTLVETIPLMLIGMALYRLGLFEGRLDRAKMRRWGWIGFAGGAALTLPIGLWVMSAGFPVLLTQFAFNGLSAFLHLPMVLGLTALLSLWAPRAAQGWLGSRVVAAGRMAFSNYLGGSILMMFVFQGWAGGQFGQLHRLGLLPFVLLAWVLMLAWSKPWLAHFRYGPLEWLWRCLTYWQLMPIRK